MFGMYASVQYHHTAMRGSRKYPYPPQGGLLEIPSESMNQSWNLNRDVGFKPKNPPWKAYGTT